MTPSKIIIVKKRTIRKAITAIKKAKKAIIAAKKEQKKR